MKLRILTLISCLCALAFPARAQVIDGVAAIVGDDIILYSDVDAQYAYLVSNGQKDDGTLRCQILEQLIIEKLLLTRAEQDSLVVSDAQVESELDRRISYFAQMYGGTEEIEKVYGKDLIEIKTELRPEIHDNLMAQQMQQKIIDAVTVTPREVRKFYNEIPKDSLPLMPAEVEMYHLVVQPKASEEARQATRDKLNAIRREILDNKISFEEAAKRYSLDFASARMGGMLGEFGHGQMVPEFEEVAFSMKENDISEVFESQFGYHVIKLHKRVGEVVTASHILLSPMVIMADENDAKARINRIRQAIVSDSIPFQKAAILWSDDTESRSCGGCVKNPQSGELRIPIDLLDADFFFKVDKMKEGEISQPLEWIRKDNKKVWHIIYLKRRIAPHTANLEDDYQRIQQAALQAKQSQAMDKWFALARKNVYIEVKDKDCESILNNWIE